MTGKIGKPAEKVVHRMVNVYQVPHTPELKEDKTALTLDRKSVDNHRRALLCLRS
jgi:hypothetical protein